MGLYDFWWNSVQSGQITDLEDQVRQLNEKVAILKEWIDYLERELAEVKKQ